MNTTHYKKETFKIENICFKKGYQISSKLCALSNRITRISYFLKFDNEKIDLSSSPGLFVHHQQIRISVFLRNVASQPSKQMCYKLWFESNCRCEFSLLYTLFTFGTLKWRFFFKEDEIATLSLQKPHYVYNSFKWTTSVPVKNFFAKRTAKNGKKLFLLNMNFRKTNRHNQSKRGCRCLAPFPFVFNFLFVFFFPKISFIFIAALKSDQWCEWDIIQPGTKRQWRENNTFRQVAVSSCEAPFNYSRSEHALHTKRECTENYRMSDFSFLISTVNRVLE